MTTFFDSRLETLITLGQELQAQDYRFTTVTPATHARVNARPENQLAGDLQGVFGWSRLFPDALVSERMLALLETGGLLQRQDSQWRSAVRWSSLDDQLFAHSAYPTLETDAVFFGPDTYRFAHALHQYFQSGEAGNVRRAVDIGCGAGPGAILIAQAFPEAEVTAVDINPRALDFTRANAYLAGIDDLQIRQSNLLERIEGQFDLIVANPPYLLDPDERTYRHGGGAFGAGLSLRIVETALQRLNVGGSLLLYTGAAVVNGEAPLRRQLDALLIDRPVSWHYEEMDPDVFGEELDSSAYQQAERIAAVTLTVKRLG
ncbi:class I SAM-dependent methyltransferase [Pseudomonas sp. BGr12]|uniref:class I SAM-dependent methyltransferase n=1 Tax=unclassified Pseudomonas TaxID=196821 RepID=UPI00177B9571|nr:MULTISPECIES: class I SAM-dependent methyltransferase [unclassified Pseudomonas]MBD9579098.1 class I SAM-dependent methyltransferase [Pseudomonas sp. PDM23]MBD9672916.1 class I SAM-dependent methyltransferase [Pseudomonas sp. PDM21]MDL2428239.1 class I SAM-dependent methyltransferase [Pseudomonas sp. BJa5]